MLKPYLSRKESIVMTTIEIIDELGVQGLSTREIAKRQGISEGTLFKHFKSKNQIILAMLDKFSQFDNEIIKSITLKQLEAKEGIIYFLNSYIEYYENYPAITYILYMDDILRNNYEIKERIRQIFDRRSNYLKGLIEDAKETGKIQACIDSEDLVDLIMGFCKNVILRWRISHCNFSLKERILPTLHVILNNY